MAAHNVQSEKYVHVSLTGLVSALIIIIIYHLAFFFSPINFTHYNTVALMISRSAWLCAFDSSLFTLPTKANVEEAGKTPAGVFTISLSRGIGYTRQPTYVYSMIVGSAAGICLCTCENVASYLTANIDRFRYKIVSRTNCVEIFHSFSLSLSLYFNRCFSTNKFYHYSVCTHRHRGEGIWFEQVIRNIAPQPRQTYTLRTCICPY